MNRPISPELLELLNKAAEEKVRVQTREPLAPIETQMAATALIQRFQHLRSRPSQPLGPDSPELRVVVESVTNELLLVRLIEELARRLDECGAHLAYVSDVAAGRANSVYRAEARTALGIVRAYHNLPPDEQRGI